MLVLTRKLGERIRIDKDIILTVVDVKGNRVRVGIEAPPRIHILRDELTDRSQTTEKQAHHPG